MGLLPGGGGARQALAAAALHRDPADLRVAALEPRVAVTGGEDLAPGLVVVDRHVGADPLDQVPDRAGLGLGERLRASVVAASRRGGVPAAGEVAVEVYPVRVAPRVRRHPVGVDAVDGPEIDVADPGPGSAQPADHPEPGLLVTVDHADHERLAV